MKEWRRHIVVLAWLTAATAAAAGDWAREVEITHEPDVEGQHLYTVRIMPAHTADYDRLQFDCVLHQEFPWEDARGRKYTKIHEPVTFSYRCAPARLVNDLDAYFNFRVPIDMARLQAKYGEKVFNAAYPVTVSRIVISGYQQDKKVWSYELPAAGKHSADEFKPKVDSTEEKAPSK